MTRTRPNRGTLVELARLVGAWFGVTALAALALRGLDAVPRLLLDEPRGIELCATIAEAERRLGEPIALPVYFPQKLGWPPASIRFAHGPPRAVAVEFHDGIDGSPELVLFQATSGDGVFPEALKSRSEPFHTVAVAIDGVDGRIDRVRLDGGEVWDELSWVAYGASHVVRFRGAGDELMRIGSSMVKHR